MWPCEDFVRRLTSKKAGKGVAERWLPGAVSKALALTSLMPPQRREPYIRLIGGKRGLEVGGPSAIFKPWGAIPLYPVVRSRGNVPLELQEQPDGWVIGPTSRSHSRPK